MLVELGDRVCVSIRIVGVLVEFKRLDVEFKEVFR